MVARSNLPPPELRSLPTPTAMFAHLDRLRVGQSRAKRDLAVAVCNHCLAQAPRDRTGEDLGRHHLLLGPTGVGKSCMVRRLAELLDVPLVFAADTQLVEVGYRGSVVDDLLRSLLAAAHSDPRRARHRLPRRDRQGAQRRRRRRPRRQRRRRSERAPDAARRSHRRRQRHAEAHPDGQRPAHARAPARAHRAECVPRGRGVEGALHRHRRLDRRPHLARERAHAQHATRLERRHDADPAVLAARQRQRRKRPRDALRVTEELRNRRIPLGDFCLAATSAGNNSLPAILHYLDCRLERTRDDAGSDRDGAQPGNAG
jgi:hypothetical protein